MTNDYFAWGNTNRDWNSSQYSYFRSEVSAARFYSIWLLIPILLASCTDRIILFLHSSSICFIQHYESMLIAIPISAWTEGKWFLSSSFCKRYRDTLYPLDMITWTSNNVTVLFKLILLPEFFFLRTDHLSFSFG